MTDTPSISASSPGIATVTTRQVSRGPAWSAVARGIALFIALYSLLNVVLEIRHRVGYRYELSLWWINFRPFYPLVRWIGLSLAAILFLWFAIDPPRSVWRRRATMTVVELLWLMIAWNIIEFYARVSRGTIATPFPVPLAIFIGLGLLMIWRATAARWRFSSGSLSWVGISAVFGACAFVLPLLEMLCFGMTDFHRTAVSAGAPAGAADAIVIFGARVYADGKPSDSLRDRVLVAAQLYRDQRSRFPAHEPPKVVLSGGQGDDEPIPEAEAMHKIALENGVPEADIIEERKATNTLETVLGTSEVFEKMVRQWLEKDDPRVEPVIFAVSHFYHLPRVKMNYLMDGWHFVYTVPVRRPMPGAPLYMVREVAAIWRDYAEMFR